MLSLFSPFATCPPFLLSPVRNRCSRWKWRLALYPSGLGATGCYSAFLELANAGSLPPGFSRYVKLEFAMLAWDAAYQVRNLTLL